MRYGDALRSLGLTHGAHSRDEVSERTSPPLKSFPPPRGSYHPSPQACCSTHDPYQPRRCAWAPAPSAFATALASPSRPPAPLPPSLRPQVRSAFIRLLSPTFGASSCPLPLASSCALPPTRPESPCALRPGPQVRSAFHRLAKRTHPDVVPPVMRDQAETEFKKILEAYHLLSTRPARYHPMRRRSSPSSPSAHATASTARAAGMAGVAGSGVLHGSAVPRGSMSHHGLVALPFVLLVLGTISLGTSCLVYSYKKATKDSKSRNPFLP
ncbi:unnamed protein product [Closterium sp. NIES-53]